MTRPNIPSRPRTEAYLQPPTQSWVEWDVTAIRNTLREHELGNFYSSGLLADWVLRDDRFKSALGTRVRAVQGLPFAMAPAKGSSDLDHASLLADQAAKVWPRIMPRSVQGETLRWTTTQGFSVSQVIWDTSGGRWVPTLEWWHPSHLWWRWDIGRLVANTTTGPVIIEPGTGEWFVHAPNGIFRGWMHGAVRSLAFLVALRQYALRDWGRASEMYGMGVRKGKIPANCDPEDRDRFLAQLAALASESILLLPQGMPDQPGFDFELEALAGQFNGQLFENLGRRCDMGITLELLGQNLTSEVQEGSLAAARVHGDVRQNYLESDAHSLADDARSQLLVPWAWYNFGAAVEDVPEPGWDVTPPEDKDASSKTLVQVSQGLTGLVSIGLGPALDVRAILEKHGVPMKPGVEPVVTAPAPAAAPGAPGPAPLAPVGAPGDGLPDGLAVLSGVMPRGAAEGQKYIDDVSDALRDKAAKIVRGDVETILAAIKGADGYREVRARLASAGRDMRPDAFADLVEKAIMLSHLAGRRSVLEDP